MESADIKALRKQRAIVKAQLTRLQSFLEDQREISITALEIRHSKLEQMFNSFTEIQTIIETKDEESDHAPEWDSFEEQYYKVAETINNQLKEIRGIGGPVSVNRTVESPNTVKQTSSLLRKIEIKPFDGNPIEWHSFHDTFRSLVHDNDELIGVQKFHLLKNALRGEATAVIDSLNATEGNYLVAWDLLCKRCNKPRKIINAHLRLLLDLPEITRDTPINLRQLAEQAQVHVNALKAIKQPTEHWDTILIHIIANKLDKNTRRAWERTLEDEEIPKFKELLDFINKHARGDDIGTENSNSLKSSNIQDRLRSKPQARNHSYVSTNEKKQVCVICKGEHPIYACTKFLQLSVRDRLDTVKRAKLCINCLRPNHIVINCRLGNCRKCDKKHHTLLHFPTQTQDSNQNNPIVSMPSTSAETSKTTLTASYDSEVLLGTAQITILDKHNMEHTCRVLLDSGSQTHFITYRLAEILQLNKQKIDLSFAGLGQLNTNAKHIVKTSIRSQTGPFQTQLEFIALPSITGMLPVRQVNIRDFNIPSHIQLADPNFHKPGEIDALLGNALFYDLLEAGQIKLEKPSIILQNTQVGWIVTGEIVNQKPNRQGRAGRLCHIATSLDTQIARFWEIEEIPEHDFLSAEETECETHFAQNTTRNEQGRYIVRLPFNENRDRLGNSKAMALKRFYSLEHKLQLNSELKAQYTEFLSEYLKLGHITLVTLSKVDLLEKYSSIDYLNRIIAYIFRFYNNTKRDSSKCAGPLSLLEIQNAHFRIIRLIQLETFSSEIDDLKNSKNVNRKSRLINLNPFIDDNGIIRVGSRLKHAVLRYEQKYPIVLPHKHHVTELIIRQVHLRQFHSGTQATLYTVRQKYWPIAGKSIVKQILHKCISCCKYNPKTPQYIMGNLPKNRIRQSRPFESVGIDYCGPFFIKEKKFRNRNKLKCYVVVFVCFATKAIHLELATDLTTESCLGALKRFLARRGKPCHVYSDNGTNFVGAKNEIAQTHALLQSDEYKNKFRKFLTQENIEWHFSPPRSPHFGGLWEAAVRSFKKHLHKTIGDAMLTYEQFYTLIVEIEAILNSRPLTPISSDPNDFLALSPNHFLIGESLASLPEQNFVDTQTNKLSLWQHGQKIKQHFWRRWQTEYLQELHTRSKWHTGDGTKIKEGTLVTIRDENCPPLQWQLGRVVALHPGEDDVVRVATIQTPHGTYKRALKKLAPLPIETN
ncbi:hypothetical protein ANTRET_LOCUS11048 [Anthophora retusa]